MYTNPRTVQQNLLASPTVVDEKRAVTPEADKELVEIPVGMLAPHFPAGHVVGTYASVFE